MKIFRTRKKKDNKNDLLLNHVTEVVWVQYHGTAAESLNTVTHLLKTRTVEPEKEPLLGNG
jgi:hypothetical protein